jgi:Ger(x)C family germination protein
MLFLTGCWDRWEIEERGFILGAGLDLAEDAQGIKPVYTITLQKVLPGQAGFGEDGGGGGEMEPVYNITSENTSILAGIREMASRTHREPYLEDLLVIVVGEDLASYDLHAPLNFFLRNPRLRWNVHLYVTPGEAKDILQIKPGQEQVSAIYISRLAENDHRTSIFPHGSNLGEVGAKLKTGDSFVLARIEGLDQEAKLAGSAVIKENRLVGWLDEDETVGLRFLAREVRAGMVVPVSVDQVKKVFRLAGVRIHCWPQLVNGEMRIVYNVWVEGDLGEDHHRHRGFDIEYLQEIEEKVAAQIKIWMRTALARLQQEYQADVVGLGRQVEKRFPGWWKEAKDKWEEELFPYIPVDINVSAYIRRSGVAQ